MSDAANIAARWESFYVIVGSSGGALIGLQFVVMTLIADRRSTPTGGALHAFGTPTVVHLSGALIVSALMSAPWNSLRTLGLVVALAGIAGLVYAAIVVRRARSQTEYVPDSEDWAWYLILPAACYLLLFVAALGIASGAERALFGTGAAALGLLLLGIRNAWDTVTHLVITTTRRE